MNGLSRHIEYLLQRHDCVIVPGFGAFIVTRRAARIDREAGVILPPSREICFNRAVCSDDGLLAHSIARFNGISFEEGRSLLAQYVEQLILSLRETKSVMLGQLGTISQGDDGTLLYRPALRGDMQGKALGLRNVPLRLKKENSPSALNPGTTNTGRGNDKGRRFNPDYYYIAINKRFAKIAAMFIAVLITVLSLTQPIGREDTDKRSYASVMPVEKLMETKVPIPVASTEKMDTAETRATAKPAAADTISHYLIVATFRTAAEAGRYIAQQKEKGQHASVVSGGRFFRIAIDSASSKERLHHRLSDPAIREEYQGAWIWQKK